MKLPKCEHCGKLMVGHLSRTVVAQGLPFDLELVRQCVQPQPRLEYEVIYLCPERIEPMEPIWVEVHEK